MKANKGQNCSKENPCRKPFVCDSVSKKCVARGSDEAKRTVKDAFRADPPKIKSKRRPKKKQDDVDVPDLTQSPSNDSDNINDKKKEISGDQSAKQAADDIVLDVDDMEPAPKVIRERNSWDAAMIQGSRGFNAYATEHMREGGLEFSKSDLKCPTAGVFKPQPYQLSPAYLLHPELPVDRMLLAHRTGTGKTYSMILILDNYFMDKRAKVLIFPNIEVQTNFYQEIMKFPSRYRSFVERETGITYEKLNASKKMNKRTKTMEVDSSLLERVYNTLALTGKMTRAGTPGYPAAPLRAMRYVTAGGAQVFSGRGQPRNPLFKLGYDGRNPYSNKIVVMDEFHYLHKPSADVLKYKSKLVRLKRALMDAKNSVIVGATATPIVDSAADGDEIMRILRGAKYANSPTNEGFISYYQDLSTQVFATVLPNGPPPHNMPDIQTVTLKGDNLDVYNTKEREKSKTLKGNALMQAIHPYATSSKYITVPANSAKDKYFRELRQNASSAASKLDAVMDYAMRAKGKVLIMCHRQSGLKALNALWKIRQKEYECSAKCKDSCPEACWITMDKTKTKTEKAAVDNMLRKYNAKENTSGKNVRVAIVDAGAYEAGVSFFDVRHLIMVDVPTTWASWMQRMGRALRFCGHNSLVEARRTLRIVMFVATREDDPSGKHRPTSDQYFMEKLRATNDELFTAMQSLAVDAVDRQVLAPLLNN